MKEGLASNEGAACGAMSARPSRCHYSLSLGDGRERSASCKRVSAAWLEGAGAEAVAMWHIRLSS